MTDSNDKAHQRFLRKQERDQAARASMPRPMPSLIKPLTLVADEPSAPKLTPSMIKAGWTIVDGRIEPPRGSERGNVSHVSEKTKKLQAERKAERKAKRKALRALSDDELAEKLEAAKAEAEKTGDMREVWKLTGAQNKRKAKREATEAEPPEPSQLDKLKAELAQWRKQAAEYHGKDGTRYNEAAMAIKELAPQVSYLEAQATAKEPVRMTLGYHSGLKRELVAEGTGTKSPLDHARSMAIAFLLYSTGNGQVVSVTIHGPRTGDETHARDEVKRHHCVDKDVFNWSAYLGRKGIDVPEWTREERVANYLEGYQRPRKGPVLPKTSYGHRTQKAKQSRVTFPRHSPRAYVGDWRTPSGRHYGSK